METYRFPSVMDEVYTAELLQQDLINACEREDRLTSKLQAAEEEMEDLRKSAIFHKRKFQELDDALEVEEGKTNTERLARQEAEKTTRQHGLEISKVMRNETIANDHCNMAESEVLRLQKELSTERSATETVHLLVCRLREDLDFAELNKNAAYDRLDVAQAKLCALQTDLGVATGRISVLERQARDLEAHSRTEHQRLEVAEGAHGALVYELNKKGLALSDLLKEYNDLKAKYIKCLGGHSMAVTPLNADTVDVDAQSQADVEEEDCSSKHKREQDTHVGKSTEKKTAVRAGLVTTKDRTIIATTMPTLPEPAILRPATASVAVCELEAFKTAGRMLPGPRVNPRFYLWKYYWRLPAKSLHLLFRGAGRR